MHPEQPRAPEPPRPDQVPPGTDGPDVSIDGDVLEKPNKEPGDRPDWNGNVYNPHDDGGGDEWIQL